MGGHSVEVPPELPLLAERARSRHTESPDAPSVIVGIRNRLVHPSKRPKSGDWPDTMVMIEAWRLALEFAELSLLRLLDYQGDYGPRRSGRRWIGNTDPVPWRATGPQR